ncbi:hypothetical protein [Deinococcus koreensis]|uniref:Uncharacterized protein n=1 Tax=Deinococcus koreensis TaxID=2054903 RepID=A0A2K3UZQ5_9DEIO|nr:hypothetical protein [Deinococcus koreensis]PNY82013.1 hypothetical protein CVO96_12110 [Deinococcus koreensis]
MRWLDPLADWLEQVTGPFPEETATRLRQELGAHAEATADALRQQGEPEPMTAALRQMGPASELRRSLETVHFTRSDLQALWALRGFQVMSPVGVTLSGLGLALLPFLPFFHGGRTFQWAAYALYLMVVLVLSVAELRLPRRLHDQSRRVLLTLARLMTGGWVLVMLTFVWLPADSTSVTAEAAAKLCGWAIGVSFLRPWALLRLLPKALGNAR